MSSAATADGPRTVVGIWLLATAAGEPMADRQRLVKKLNNGVPGINDDEPAVVTAACELALKRLFVNGHTEQQITDLVALIRSRITVAEAPAQYEIEGVIKAALDGVAASAVTLGRQFVIEGLLFAVACLRLALARGEISELVCRGERVAFAAGFHPQLSVNPDL